MLKGKEWLVIVNNRPEDTQIIAMESPYNDERALLAAVEYVMSQRRAPFFWDVIGPDITIDGTELSILVDAGRGTFPVAIKPFSSCLTGPDGFVTEALEDGYLPYINADSDVE